MDEVNWFELMGQYHENEQTLAIRALRTQADPDNPLNWGVRDGKFVRMRAVGEFEELSNDQVRVGMRHLELQKNMKPPEKSLIDRSYELLFHWIACQTRPSTLREDDEELPREAVRFCRALESEVAKPTERPEKKPRVARRAHDEDDEVYR